MPHQPRARLKTILKQPPQQRFILGQRHHTVANISRRKNAIFPPQPPRRPAIIRYRNDRHQVRNRTLRRRVIVAAPHAMLLEPPQQRRQARTPAKRDHAKPAAKYFWSGGFFGHEGNARSSLSAS